MLRIMFLHQGSWEVAGIACACFIFRDCGTQIQPVRHISLLETWARDPLAINPRAPQCFFRGTVGPLPFRCPWRLWLSSGNCDKLFCTKKRLFWRLRCLRCSQHASVLLAEGNLPQTTEGTYHTWEYLMLGYDRTGLLLCWVSFVFVRRQLP